MNDRLSMDLVSELTARVLMDGAFIMAEPVSEPPPLRGELLQASIGFEGPCRGSVTVIMPATLATTLAANLLGVDAADSDAMSRRGDALGELLNMVGGALLGEICPPAAPGRLGLPQVGRAGTSLPPAGAEAVSLVTDEGDGIELRLQLDGQTP